MDREGTLHYRWISRGGCQITGRLYVQHAQRVCSAWRTREAVETHAGDVYATVGDSKTLRLRKAQ
jgi:hypothetical protein